MIKKVRCEAKNKNGKRCKNLTTHISKLCHIHRIKTTSKQNTANKPKKRRGLKYSEYIFPRKRTGGYLTEESFSVSAIPQRANRKIGPKPSENKVAKYQQGFAAGFGPSLNTPNQRRGGMCGECGNTPTRLIYVGGGGGGDPGGWGTWTEYEYYCPECKMFTLVKQATESY